MRRDRNVFVRSAFELHSKSTARTPATVGSESAPTIGDVGKWEVMIAARAPIPAVVRVERILGKSANPRESFVGEANHVAIEIVAWIAQMPQESAAALTGPVPIGRNWFVGVSEPPDRVEFLAGAEPVRLLWNVNNGY